MHKLIAIWKPLHTRGLPICCVLVYPLRQHSRLSLCIQAVSLTLICFSVSTASTQCYKHSKAQKYNVWKRSINVAQMSVWKTFSVSYHCLSALIEGALLLSLQCNPRCLDVCHKPFKLSLVFCPVPSPRVSAVKASGRRATASKAKCVPESLAFHSFHVSSSFDTGRSTDVNCSWKR